MMMEPKWYDNLNLKRVKDERGLLLHYQLDVPNGYGGSRSVKLEAHTNLELLGDVLFGLIFELDERDETIRVNKELGNI